MHILSKVFIGSKQNKQNRIIHYQKPKNQNEFQYQEVLDTEQENMAKNNTNAGWELEINTTGFKNKLIKGWEENRWVQSGNTPITGQGEDKTQYQNKYMWQAKPCDICICSALNHATCRD